MWSNKKLWLGLDTIKDRCLLQRQLRRMRTVGGAESVLSLNVFDIQTIDYTCCIFSLQKSRAKTYISIDAKYLTIITYDLMCMLANGGNYIYLHLDEPVLSRVCLKRCRCRRLRGRLGSVRPTFAYCMLNTLQ